MQIKILSYFLKTGLANLLFPRKKYAVTGSDCLVLLPESR